MAREKTLDDKVLDFLKSKGAWCIKYWAGGKYTKSGVPDILACIDGCFFGIEDKAKNGRPTMLQLANLKKIHSAGGFGILLYPDQYPDFKKFVDELFEHDRLTVWQLKWYRKNLKLQKKWKEKLEKL